MHKKTILLTGGKGMLAYDFIKTQSEKFEIVALDRSACDITSFESIVRCLAHYQPDVLLNCAAYTAVDDAEDIGMQTCFDVNTLGVKYLAKATAIFGVQFMTISTDYVFDGTQKGGYLPNDACHPINIYGMSKYLGEKLALDENPRTCIVRTSWLYGGEVYDGNPEKPGVYKNFVNTMLKLSDTHHEIRVVADQYGTPTSCVNLAHAISLLMDSLDEFLEKGENIFHFSSLSENGGVTWADFAGEIFRIAKKDVTVIKCDSAQYPMKAKRPASSILHNTSPITLSSWKDDLSYYISSLKI